MVWTQETKIIRWERMRKRKPWISFLLCTHLTTSHKKKTNFVTQLIVATSKGYANLEGKKEHNSWHGGCTCKGSKENGGHKGSFACPHWIYQITLALSWQPNNKNFALLGCVMWWDLQLLLLLFGLRESGGKGNKRKTINFIVSWINFLVNVGFI